MAVTVHQSRPRADNVFIIPHFTPLGLGRPLSLVRTRR
jgi:hypothetical protein